MPSYIVIASPCYGGAEKRFFDIFRSIREQGYDVLLIAPSTLTESLLSDHDNSEELKLAMLPIDLPVWNRWKFIAKFQRLLLKLPRCASFHYPMNCLWPLHLGRHDRVTMSVTDCHKVPSPFGGSRNQLLSWLSFFFVDRVDVLNPTIFSKMAKYRMSWKMTLTPGGTFLHPMVVKGHVRQPKAVLLSRLVPGKGIDDLLDVLPQVWSKLRALAPSDFRFEFAGYGPLEEHVVNRIAILARSGVPVSFIGYADAVDLLTQSSIALSMQETTNYPSRVVAEALVAGCAVIVRNSGDSMHFGNDVLGLEYCTAKLDPEELANLLNKWLYIIKTEEQVSSRIAMLAIDKFSSKNSVEYFTAMLFSESYSKRGRFYPM